MHGYSVSTSTPGRVGRDWDMLLSNVSMSTLVSVLVMLHLLIGTA